MIPRETLIIGLKQLALGVYELGVNREAFLDDAAAQMEADARELDRLREVAKGYEQWEADVIMDDNCWRDSPMVLSQKQYDRLIELQQLRNRTTKGN